MEREIDNGCCLFSCLELWGENADVGDTEGGAHIDYIGDGLEVESWVTPDKEDLFGARGVNPI